MRELSFDFMVNVHLQRDELMRMFVNTEEDSEVRIKSYLAIMQCPTTQALYQVKQMLSTEQVNQVTL